MVRNKQGISGQPVGGCTGLPHFSLEGNLKSGQFLGDCLPSLCFALRSPFLALCVSVATRDACLHTPAKLLAFMITMANGCGTVHSVRLCTINVVILFSLLERSVRRVKFNVDALRDISSSAVGAQSCIRFETLGQGSSFFLLYKTSDNMSYRSV